jgi:hypothetical protein
MKFVCIDTVTLLLFTVCDPRRVGDFAPDAGALWGGGSHELQLLPTVCSVAVRPSGLDCEEFGFIPGGGARGALSPGRTNEPFHYF